MNNYCIECGVFVMHPTMVDGKPYCPGCARQRGLRQSGNPVNIPLDIQKRILHMSVFDTVFWLRQALDDEDFVAELEEMAVQRLVAGYEQYGSEMYGWDAETRRRAVMEELADVLAYGSSGRFS